jgi:hypothetical protein
VRVITVFTGLAVMYAALALRGEAGPSKEQAAAAHGFGSVAEVEAAYRCQHAELERKKLADLVALTQQQAGEESEHAYRAAFDLAVARGFYRESEPAARLAGQAARRP